MILKNQPTHNFAGQAFFLYLLAAMLIGVLLMWGFSYVGAIRSAPEDLSFPAIFCDLETVDTVGQDVFFTTGAHRFTNGATVSEDRARSGVRSSRLDKDHLYGIGYSWTTFQPGERIQVSVWRYGDPQDGGALVIHGQGNQEFYHQEHVAVRTDEKDWSLLERVFEVPLDFEGTLSVYVLGSGENVVYFDDFSIEKIRDATGAPILADSQITVLELKIGAKDWEKLGQKREEARREGFLVTEDEDWAKAEILEESGNIPIKIRLKGDLVDHLSQEKWSFRIQVKAPYSWQRMTTFSVHTPAARSQLMEWVYHQLLEREDILTPRYDFILLRINGKNLGIYACEEHFVKQLAEYKSRREGPIIRMEEEGVWLARKQGTEYGQDWGLRELDMKSYEAARIQPFDEKRTLADSLLARQFAIAQNLLYQHKFNLRPASELFDLDLLAKYYAITDLTQAYHSIVWHNERFYYNPILSRLEPIGFDGYTHTGIFLFNSKVFLGGEIASLDNNPMGDRINALFLDPAFAERYYHFLHTFSSRAYINEFLMDLEPALLKRENLIRREFDTYTYDRNHLPRRGAELARLLVPVNDAAIAVYTQSSDQGRLQLRMANFHATPLQITGWGTTDKGPDQALAKPLMAPCYERGKIPVYVETEVPLRAQYLYYRVPGLDTHYFSRILSWSVPQVQAPAQGLFSELNLPGEPVCRLTENRILFLPGNHRLEKDIIIPAAYEVKMGPGVRLNLVKGAKFISRSPVQLLGEAGNPVEIFSEDHSAQGFTVLQAREPSSLRHVIFSDLNTLSHEGWQLTGAVTFYESDVSIDQSVFRRAHCEDGLNLVRSKFTLRNSLISDAFSDGLDTDFCTGEISHTRFQDTGNDGMDLSGSVIRVLDCEVSGAGDKGISVGEQSTVHANRIRITSSVIGVAAKDLSELLVSSISLKDCVTGFAAYQKKPEFGGSVISVDSYTAEDVQHLHLIEHTSRLSLGGKVVEGI